MEVLGRRRRIRAPLIKAADFVPILVVFAIVAVAFFVICWNMSADKSIFSSDFATIVATLAIFMTTTQALGAIADLLTVHGDTFHFLLMTLKYLSFSPQLLKADCVLQSNDPALSYLVYLLILPCMVAAIAVAGKIREKLRGALRWATVFSHQGSVVLVMYLASARAAVLPLQCATNPDGSSSVLSYRSVICWESPNHFVMVALAAVGMCIFTCAPLAAVSWAAWVYPTRIQSPGGTEFLERWRFAFDRFSIENYGYAVVYLFRNFLIALTPVVFTNSQHLQVLLLALVIVFCLAVQVRLMPWRTQVSNLVDALASISVCILLIGSSMLLLLTSEGTALLQTWVLLQLVATLSIFAAILFMQLRRKLSRKRQYHVFISHHKNGAAALARWFKTCMLTEKGLKIFLDSDDLLSVDVLFDIVAHQTRNLVLLLTKDFFSRPWCVGELVSAIQSKVPVVCVRCHDCDVINTDLLVEQLKSMWKESHKVLLASLGISTDLVAKAIAHLQHQIIPVLELDRSALEEDQVKVVSATLQACKLNAFLGIPGKHRGKSILATGPVAHTRIVLISSWQDEARTCCFLVRRKLMSLMHIGVEVTEESQLHLLGDRTLMPQLSLLVVLLTQGVLADPFVANALLLAGNLLCL